MQACADEGVSPDAIIDTRPRFLVTGILERVGERRYRVAGTVFREWLAGRPEAGLPLYARIGS